MRTKALVSAGLSSTALWGSAPVDAAPVRPAVSRPAFSVLQGYTGNLANKEAQYASSYALFRLEQADQQWRETQEIINLSTLKGDFILDMVDPETLAVFPAIAEYDVAYVAEWDDDTHPVLDVDEWEIAQVLENVGFAPPESSVSVRVVISGIRAGKPHRASIEEVDYKLIESLRGEL